MREKPESEPPILIVTADDYGYWPSYNRGILRAIENGAVDAVGALVERDHCDPEPLIESGVEVGLHLEFEGRWGRRSGKPARNALRVQFDRFVDLFGRLPAYIDGHRHCHARPEMLSHVNQLAKQLQLPVRSVGSRHRTMLRQRDIATQDHLIGRDSQEEPHPDGALGTLSPGVTIWYLHPGYPDPAAGSSYDHGREEDLDLLISLMLRARSGSAPWGEAVRSTHGEALMSGVRG